jgi:hypothetical protein
MRGTNCAKFDSINDVLRARRNRETADEPPITADGDRVDKITDAGFLKIRRRYCRFCAIDFAQRAALRGSAQS